MEAKAPKKKKENVVPLPTKYRKFIRISLPAYEYLASKAEWNESLGAVVDRELKIESKEK